MSRTASPGPLSTQVHRQAELMDRMMRALGIDGAAAVRLDCGGAFALARTQCLHCQNSRGCVAWLASAERPSSPPEFCAAATFFCRLRDATQTARQA
jgi:Family of unknown function (DUF6455)